MAAIYHSVQNDVTARVEIITVQFVHAYSYLSKVVYRLDSEEHGLSPYTLGSTFCNGKTLLNCFSRHDTRQKGELRDLTCVAAEEVISSK